MCVGFRLRCIDVQGIMQRANAQDVYYAHRHTHMHIPTHIRTDIRTCTYPHTHSPTHRMATQKAPEDALFDMLGLDVPRPDNGFIAVTMYSDVNEKKPVNDRATTLARAFGHETIVIYGDAFVGRAFYGDASTDSHW